jgi:hypothetical protein
MAHPSGALWIYAHADVGYTILAIGVLCLLVTCIGAIRLTRMPQGHDSLGQRVPDSIDGQLAAEPHQYKTADLTVGLNANLGEVLGTADSP